MSRVDGLLSGVGLRSARARDLALAVLVAALSGVAVAVSLRLVIDIDGVAVTPAQAATGVAIAVAQGLALVGRHRCPVGTLAAVALLQVVGFAVLPLEQSVRGLATLVAAYSVGAHSPRTRGNIAVGAIVLGEAVLGGLGSVIVQPALFGGTAASDPLVQRIGFLALIAAPTYVGAALVGRMVATRREYLALVELRAREAIAEQKQRADAAIAAERTRMARELHDIAAHHLSGIAVQAAAAERLVDANPEAAKESIRWMRAQSKDTLANLRVAVGMLRESGAGLDDGGAPVPGLSVIGQLVEDERELGASVSLDVDGSPVELSPIADVAFYRVAQESLANARDHSPGAPVTVTLRFGDTVALEVRNPLVAASVTEPGRNPLAASPERVLNPAASATERNRGLGLIGMRERALLIGARFTAGPAGTDWVVRLELDTVIAAPSGQPETATSTPEVTA